MEKLLPEHLKDFWHTVERHEHSRDDYTREYDRALAEYHDISLGDLLEGIVLHAFEGKCAFRDDSLQKISDLKKVYELDLTAGNSHHLREA